MCRGQDSVQHEVIVLLSSSLPPSLEIRPSKRKNDKERRRDKKAGIALISSETRLEINEASPVQQHVWLPRSPTHQVRPACVEDHDDLMPVFAAQSDLLSATYGEFFLADMIELQDNENKVHFV